MFPLSGSTPRVGNVISKLETHLVQQQHDYEKIAWKTKSLMLL